MRVVEVDFGSATDLREQFLRDHNRHGDQMMRGCQQCEVRIDAMLNLHEALVDRLEKDLHAASRMVELAFRQREAVIEDLANARKKVADLKTIHARGWTGEPTA